MKHPVKLILLSMVLVYTTACKKSATAPPLAISTISPEHGPEYTNVTIAGTGFSTTLSNNHVLFNGKAAVVSYASATELTVAVPRQAGTGHVSVTVGGANLAGPVFTYEISDATVTTLAGSNLVGTADGNGTAAQFSDITSLTTDAGGNIYAADANRIRKITPSGDVTTIAGGNNAGFLDGTGSAARFNTLQGIAIDAGGNLYVADAGNNRIRKITPAGVVTTLAGTGALGYVDGNAATAQFGAPNSIRIDANGNLYLTDQVVGSVIRKITPAGIVSSLAGGTSRGYIDGPAAGPRFNAPRGLVLDAGGNLFVSDCRNNVVRKITPGGFVSTWAGNGTAGLLDGYAVTAEFNTPEDMGIDTSGNLLVADYGNSSLRLITPQGIVSTLAGGTLGFDDGNKATARFSGLSGIAVDKNGNIYVADEYNFRLRKVVVE